MVHEDLKHSAVPEMPLRYNIRLFNWNTNMSPEIFMMTANRCCHAINAVNSRPSHSRMHIK